MMRRPEAAAGLVILKQARSAMLKNLECSFGRDAPNVSDRDGSGATPRNRAPVVASIRRLTLLSHRGSSASRYALASE